MAAAKANVEREQRVIEAIDAQNAGIRDIDRERKYAKMMRSPYRFFRGTNHLFWADVRGDWRLGLFGGRAETRTWLQGDAHAHNHGAYGDDRQGVHFGMDDFDDALIGDYQFDLWRHAASMVLDAEENVGLETDKIRRAIRHFVTSYLDTLADGIPAEAIHVAYEDPPLRGFMKKVQKKHGVARQLDKWTKQADDGSRRFDTEYHKLGGLSAAERQQLLKALNEQYPATLANADSERADFSIIDVARRIDAGTGSLGVDRFYALIHEHSADLDDYVLLDVKQQTEPPMIAHRSASERRRWRRHFEHEARRHAQAAYALAQHPDAYLGWLSLGETWFSVRRRSPYKKDFPTHKIDGFKPYRALVRQWGRIIAREHLRGAAHLAPDDPQYFGRAVTERISNDRDTFKAVVVEFGLAYAERARRDYAIFVGAHSVSQNTAVTAS